MPAHKDRQLLPYTPRQLYTLVADIERYPEFIPWCRAARLIPPPPFTGEGRGEGTLRDASLQPPPASGGSVIYAELVICFKHVSESYTSRVTLHPPAGEYGACAIEAKMVTGPFEYLINEWRFTPEGDRTCLDFLVDFKFRSRMLDMMVGGVFAKAVNKMSDAFRQRAEALYGQKG